jgi:hypothetical protein
VASCAPLRAVPVERPGAVAFVADRHDVVATSRGDIVLIAADGTVTTENAFVFGIAALAIAPDAARLIVANAQDSGDDPRVKRYTLPALRQEGGWIATSDWVSALAAYPGGALAAVGADAIELDLTNGKTTRGWTAGERPGPIAFFVFDGGGKVAFDRAVTDRKTGERLAPLEVDPWAVSADGAAALVEGKDGGFLWPLAAPIPEAPRPVRPEGAGPTLGFDRSVPVAVSKTGVALFCSETACDVVTTR